MSSLMFPDQREAQESNAATPLIGEGEGCGVLSQNGCRYNSFCYYSYHYSILYCSLGIIILLLLLMFICFVSVAA